ncbi:MAG TPA: hypothetical protein VF614_05225 [Chthoniobacteraceae bacterium]
MLKGSNGTHFSARVLRSTAVAITGVALGFALWTATAPISVAQDASPEQMIQQSLPQGRTMANASKPQFLAAVCSAVKKFRNAAPQIVRAASEARAAWRNDIIRTAVRCLGTRDCALLGRIHSALISAYPDDASAITDLFVQLAPDCDFGGTPDPGGFENPPGNLNPPPGSVGGSGGQGNLVAICHNGFVIFVSPNAVQAHLNHGDTLGACQVTPSQNR